MEAFQAQSARDAQRMNYGGPSYWEHLERAAHEHRAYWLRHGDTLRADEMLTRSLAQALAGNDGA